MIIRAADDKDIEALFEIYKEFEKSEHDFANKLREQQGLKQSELVFSEDEVQDLLKIQINDLGIKFIVAEDEGEIIGYARGWIEGKGYLDDLKNRGWFDAVVVVSKYKRTGVGSKLCDYLENWFREQNCESIDISHFYSNKIARMFYEKRGYIPTVLKLNKLL